MNNLRRIREHGFKDGIKSEQERILQMIEPIIIRWYGIRRGSEQRKLNEFVQFHVIQELIEELCRKIKKIKDNRIKQLEADK